jgi:lipopolysaccharide heptosyltransferase II
MRPAPCATVQPRRILAIRVDGIGDAIALLPALQALRKGYPAAEIDLLTSPPAAELLAGDPRVDRVLATRFLFEGPSRGRGRCAPRLREWRATVRRLRERRYDLAIDFRGDFRTILWLTCASGAPRRLSWFHVSAGRPLLTEGAEGPGPLHEVAANLRLVAALGLPALECAPRIEVSPTAARQAEALLRTQGLAGRSRVGFHCFAISPLRTWPAERFVRVIDRLMFEEGIGVVLLGSASEAPAARALAARCTGRPTSLAGETTLPEIAAVLSRLDLLVCLDSGLLHLAAAVGTPTVSLFGPGDPDRWRPLTDRHTVLWRGLPCSPCRDVRCPYPVNHCLHDITVEDVLAAVRHQLRSLAVLRC